MWPITRFVRVGGFGLCCQLKILCGCKCPIWGKTAFILSNFTADNTVLQALKGQFTQMKHHHVVSKLFDLFPLWNIKKEDIWRNVLVGVLFSCQ